MDLAVLSNYAYPNGKRADDPYAKLPRAAGGGGHVSLTRLCELALFRR